MKEIIRPHESCSKSVFILLGIFLLLWGIFFSFFLIFQGAWPVSLFLGIEYILIVFLIKTYFKKRNINDQIIINEEEINIKKYQDGKLSNDFKFNVYWAKILFTKFRNNSKLLIRESGKEAEVASFLHTKLKQDLYLRMKNSLKKNKFY